MPNYYQEEQTVTSGNGSYGWNGDNDPNHKDPSKDFGTAKGVGFGTNSYGYSQGQHNAAAIQKAQQFGAAALASQAYAGPSTLNYGGSNATLAQAAGFAAPDFSAQQQALAQNYAVANGAPSQATQLGYQTLNNGLAAQQAAAGSAMGGSLAQAAALRQAAQGQAGLQAQGSSSIAATQAQEQDAARQRYAAQIAAMRSGNTAAMNQYTQTAGAQAQNAQDAANYVASKRAMADQADMFGQNLAQSMDQSNYNTQQQEGDMYSQYQHARAQQHEAEKDRFAKIFSASVSGGGGLVGSIAGSDSRMKEPVTLSKAAEMRLMR